MPAVQETVDQVRRIDVDQYKYGFETLIESDKAPKGLSEDTVRFISAKKSEPDWMLAWRLDAYKRWLTMREPTWAKVEYGPIDYQDLYYYSAPKQKDGPKSLDDIDPEILPARTASAVTAPVVLPSTRCSIRFRSPPPSRPSSPRPACCSCRSRKPSTSIPIW
jgi:hypothetical protein